MFLEHQHFLWLENSSSVNSIFVSLRLLYILVERENFRRRILWYNCFSLKIITTYVWNSIYISLIHIVFLFQIIDVLLLSSIQLVAAALSSDIISWLADGFRTAGDQYIRYQKFDYVFLLFVDHFVSGEKCMWFRKSKTCSCGCGTSFVGVAFPASHEFVRDCGFCCCWESFVYSQVSFVCWSYLLRIFDFFQNRYQNFYIIHIKTVQS